VIPDDKVKHLTRKVEVENRDYHGQGSVEEDLKKRYRMIRWIVDGELVFEEKVDQDELEVLMSLLLLLLLI